MLHQDILTRRPHWPPAQADSSHACHMWLQVIQGLHAGWAACAVLCRAQQRYPALFTQNKDVWTWGSVCSSPPVSQVRMWCSAVELRNARAPIPP